MGSFRIFISLRAKEELFAAPFPFRRQINQRIMELKEEPRPVDAEQISEAEKYRLTAHGWSVVYTIDDVERLVAIWAVRSAL